MAGASMQPIYERLNAVAGYNPLTADTFGDWAMEAGDIVKVVRGTEEFDVPVHSSTLVWRGKQRISIDSTGKKERDSIAKASAQKYGRGGAAVRGQQELYQHFESEDNSIRSEFAISYESLRVQFENEITSTRSEFQMTSESLRIQFENEIASTRAEFQMTSESLRIQFENEIASTRSEFRMTSESLRIHFENEIASTRSEFQMTSESLRIQFENEIASTRSEFQMTSESLRIQFESEISSTRSDIEVQANRIGLVVSGTGANARIRPAQIVAAINDSTSEVLLNADKVKISGSTTINDVMSVSENRLSISVPMRVSDNILASSVTLRDQGGTSLTLDEGTLENVIKSATVTGNTLTLTPMRGDPITFSKATTLSGEWSGTTYTVTASPQGTTNQTTVYLAIEGALNPNETVYAKIYKDNPNVQANMLTTSELNLVEDVANKKVYLKTATGALTKGTISTEDTWQDGYDTANGKYTAVNAYEEMSAGGTLYYQSKLDQTHYNAGTETKYDRGSTVTAREIVTSGGTVFYTAGTAANYYKEVSSGGTVYYTAGSAFNCYKELSSGGGVYYTAGTSGNYYKEVSSGGTVYYTAGTAFNCYKELSSGGAVYYTAGTQLNLYDAGTTTKYARGTGYSVTPIGTTYYYVRHAVSEKPTSAWYTRTTTKPASGTTYDIRYAAGTATTVYPGNGGSFTVQGAAHTVTPIGSTSIRVDSRSLVTPISSTSIRVNAKASVTPISSTSIRVDSRSSVTPISSTSIRVNAKESVTPIGITSTRIAGSATFYKGDGGAFTPQGTLATLNVIDGDKSIRVNSRSILYKKSN